MADIRSLEQTLEDTVALPKARCNFVAKFLVALLQVKTTNLSEIAQVFAGRARPDSHYKRIQRFLRFFAVPLAAVATLIVKLLPIRGPFVLTLDRTNWQLGQTPLNLLVLGVAWRGVSFPLLWSVLEKKGNSNTTERIALIERCSALFGVRSIAYLTADREFIGKKWFHYLDRKRIDFRIRVKENTQVMNKRGQQVPVWRLFRSQRIGCPLTIASGRQCWGLELYFSGLRLPSGEYVIIAAPKFTPAALEDYRVRWGIETLFGCLKSRGFRLEETHVTDPERLQKLLALLALAFSWAHLIGEWLAQAEPLRINKLKKHGRPAKSLFRHGLDHLRRILCNLESPAQRIAFRRVIQLLSCT